MDISAITLTELRTVVALAETGHFGHAADRCHVTQPALSAQLKKLEENLGVRLFERTSRRVRPTAAGERVVARARVILGEVNALTDEALGDRPPLTGTLRLGVIPTLGPYLLPQLIAPLRAAYPQLRLVLREALTGVLLEELLSHRLDAALLALPVSAPGLAVEPLFDEPFWLLSAARDQLARRKRPCEDDLTGERVLLLSEGHCLRDQALAICHARGTDEGFGATSLETLRHLVAAGLGCTLLPALAVPALTRDDAVVARPFRDPCPGRQIGLVWRRTYPDEAGIHALAEFVRSRLPARVGAGGVRAIQAVKQLSDGDRASGAVRSARR